jgi:hypothetical protein
MADRSCQRTAAVVHRAGQIGRAGRGAVSAAISAQWASSPSHVLADTIFGKPDFKDSRPGSTACTFITVLVALPSLPYERGSSDRARPCWGIPGEP